MTADAIAAAGWLVAAPALGFTVAGRRRCRRTLRAVARAEHELRGPLMAIRLGVDLGVRQGRLGERRLRAIRGELERAELSLADLGHARRGETSATATGAVDLRAVVADSVEAWRPAAEAAGVTLELGWGSGQGVVRGDRVRLAQATGNLIANAIEHGGTRVRVSGSGGAGGARLEISDDGPGLPLGIADLAARRDGTGNDGRGHGLAIAARVAAAHGGRLAAATAGAPGEPPLPGASLVLELPGG